MRYLLLFLLLSACTTSRVAQPGTAETGAFLRAVSGDVVTVRLAGGETAQARAIRLGPDSTSWIAPASGTLRSVATADVVSLERTDRTRGAVRGGVTAAAVVGVAATVAAYALQKPEDCTATLITSCGPGSRIALSVAAGSAAGFLAAFPGAGIGALVGETDRLTLAPLQRVTEAGWAPGPPLARGVRTSANQPFDKHRESCSRSPTRHVTDLVRRAPAQRPPHPAPPVWLRGLDSSPRG